jgi:hypothetical protein
MLLIFEIEKWCVINCWLFFEIENGDTVANFEIFWADEFAWIYEKITHKKRCNFLLKLLI